MSQNIKIIGVPIDIGQTLRGVDMGPGAIRYAGLSARLEKLGFFVMDSGNIDVPIRDTLQGRDQQDLLAAIAQAGELIYLEAKKSVAADTIPIFLGGDHSVAIGSIGGVTDQSPVGLIWIDAHADFNSPETSPSGNIHGMSLAVLVGRGPAELVDIGRAGAKVVPENVVLIGVRDLDSLERALLMESGVAVYTMRDIDERGVADVMAEVMDRLDHLSRVHVSLDMDVVDPAYAPGVGTPVAGGLTGREAHLIMEIIADSKKLSSLDIVEINPILDQANATGQLAADLAVSLFGKSIL